METPGTPKYEVLKAPIGPDEFRLLLEEFSDAYMDARHGPPWFDESLTTEKSSAYLSFFPEHHDFTAFAAVDSRERVIGAHIFFLVSLDELRNERGNDIYEFTTPYCTAHTKLVWEQEIFVGQKYQGLGIAKKLGQLAYRYISTQFDNGLMLRRIRRDNIASIRIAESAEFQPTGVTEASINSNAPHDFWGKHFKS